MSLRSAGGNFLLAVASGIVASFLWAWIEPKVPLPRPVVTTVPLQVPAASSPAANRPGFLATLKQGVAEGSSAIGPYLPKLPLAAFCALAGLWFVTYWIQVFAQMLAVWEELITWMEDEMHPALWPFIVLTVFPLTFPYGLFVAVWFGTAMWLRTISWPFRKIASLVQRQSLA